MPPKYPNLVCIYPRYTRVQSGPLPLYNTQCDNTVSPSIDPHCCCPPICQLPSSDPVGCGVEPLSLGSALRQSPQYPHCWVCIIRLEAHAACLYVWSPTMACLPVDEASRPLPWELTSPHSTTWKRSGIPSRGLPKAVYLPGPNPRPARCPDVGVSGNHPSDQYPDQPWTNNRLLPGRRLIS